MFVHFNQQQLGSQVFTTCIVLVERFGSRRFKSPRKTLISDLHEKAGDQRSADVEVIVSAAEVRAPSRQAEAVHDPRQLLPNVVRRHQRAVVDKVIVAPLSGFVVCARHRNN